MKILRKIRSGTTAARSGPERSPAQSAGVRASGLDTANRRAVEEGGRVRPVTTKEILHTHRKAFPYHGWVDVESGLCPPFVMFCGNDEAVALDTVWNGRFGYERGSLGHWSRLAAASSTVVDVGAHVGYYAMVAALSAPKAAVHAFEPVPPVHARLAVNHRANGLRNLHLHAEGVSDRGGRADINIRFRMNNLLSTGSTLEEFTEPLQGASTYRVPLTTLDEAFPEKPVDLIKIDVEGHEPHVLTGARRLLERHRPTVLLEALRESELDGLTAHFKGLDYTFHWIAEKDGGLVPITEARPEKSRNLLFAPRGTDAG
ncbi:FkbM family methyltransferase [Streptomyces sp. NPDC060194]|uniref:FkbM family methyltransferase n=1 Tax=Streptomyces sp. NPDC060194 TaxID=3347069 RepID=UPI00365A7BD4